MTSGIFPAETRAGFWHSVPDDFSLVAGKIINLRDWNALTTCEVCALEGQMMRVKKSQQQSAPIPCRDSDGNGHTVFEVSEMQSTVYLDGSTSEPQTMLSEWYRLSGGEGKLINKFIDSETGEVHFRCPDLAGLVLTPDKPIRE